MPGEVSAAFRDKLLAKRDEARSRAEAICLRAKAESRQNLTGDEDRDVRGYTTTMRQLDGRIRDTEQEIARMGEDKIGALSSRIAAATTTNRSSPMSSSHTYRPGTRTSYLRDLMRISMPGMDDTGESRRRLSEHADEVATHGDYAEHRDLSRADGTGGYGVPPSWLMDQYIELARPGRAFANLVQRQPLPGGTDSINLPKLVTGTATAVQTADNQPVAEQDLSDTFVNCPVRTIAGQQSVAIQLIDQSPIAFDEVVFRDLIADFSTQLDKQVLYGTGLSGQVLGVALTPNVATLPVATLDIAGIYKAIANAIQTVHVTRFQPPECIVMHPRRWGWLLSLLDQNNRPLFQPSDTGGALNPAGILSDVDSQAVVGRTHGLPIVTDPNIRTNAGTGSNEDVIYVLRASDCILWESGIRARVLPEPKAANLTVLLQVYGYCAFTAGRYPQSIVELTGLTPPTF